MFTSDTRNKDTVYIDAENGTEYTVRGGGAADKASEIPIIEMVASGTGSLRTGMKYLTASLIIAAAAAVYGLFSHGVYSYYMTYAFMIPLLGGAMPHLIAAMKGTDEQDGSMLSRILGAKDLQVMVITTLTVGSILKGALDIYGTTNRLLIAYPVLAVLVLVLGIGLMFVKDRLEFKDPVIR